MPFVSATLVAPEIDAEEMTIPTRHPGFTVGEVRQQNQQQGFCCVDWMQSLGFALEGETRQADNADSNSYPLWDTKKANIERDAFIKANRKSKR